MASGIYNRFKANLFNGEIDLESDDIRVALMGTSHSFTATDNEWSDVSANEMSGTGYTANGELLSGSSVTQAATTLWDGTDIVWSSATFSAYHIVIYDDTLTNNDLICSFDLGGEQEVASSTFTIQWNASGIINMA